MAKKKKKSFKSNKLKISRKEQAKAVAEFYGAEMTDADYLQYIADLEQVASGRYQGKLSGRDLAIAFLGDVTPAEFQRDLAAAQKINPEMTEDQFIRNLAIYKDQQQEQIDLIIKSNPHLHGKELSLLIATQVFGSE